MVSHKFLHKQNILLNPGRYKLNYNRETTAESAGVLKTIGIRRLRDKTMYLLSGLGSRIVIS